MANRESQRAAREGKGRTSRREFITAASATMLAVTATAAGATVNDGHTLTAERLAALIEAPETPPAVRDLLLQLCQSIDTWAGEPVSDDEYDFVYGWPADITPGDIRRELPARLRKVAHWRSGFDGTFDLYDPAGEGGRADV